MNSFYARLDALYENGDLAAVEPCIRDQLKTIEFETGANSPEYAAVLNELAGFLRGVSRYAESEEAFERALEIMRVNDTSRSPQYATMLLNLAGLYRLTSQYDKAIALFAEAKMLLAAADMTTGDVYASLLNNLALAYQDTGDFDAALSSATEAYELCIKLGSGDHEKAASLNNLAVICLRAGNTPEAERYIDKALTVYDHMPEEDVHHAAALTTKATLLYRTGQYRGALDFFLRARKLTARFFGRNIEYAAGERHLGMTYLALDDKSAAAEHLKTAHDVYESILGPDNDRTKDCAALLFQLTAKQPI